MAEYPTAQKYSVSNGTFPSLGQIYAFQLSLVAGTPQIVDLRPALYSMNISSVQGIFVDNSNGGASLSISGSSGQPIVIAEAYQALMPLYMSADLTLTFTGSGSVGITLLNFPTPAVVWSTVPPTYNFTGTSLDVTDVILDACVTGGALAVNATALGSSDLAVHTHVGTAAYEGTIATATTSAIITGAPSCYVSAIDVWASGSATLGSAGYITVTLKFATAGTVLVRSVYIPASATNVSQQIAHFDGLQLMGNAASDTFEITLGTALTAGSIEYTIIGGTTGTP